MKFRLSFRIGVQCVCVRTCVFETMELKVKLTLKSSQCPLGMTKYVFCNINVSLFVLTEVFCGKPHLRDFINVVRISGNSYFYGDKITYRCRAGVAPANTPPEITCQADGLWDGDIACGGNLSLLSEKKNSCVQILPHPFL